MKTTIKINITILLSICFCFLAEPSLAAGFGVSPPWIRNDLLLPGNKFEKTIYLTRKDCEQSALIRAEIEAPGFLEWIEIVSGEEFSIPAGVSRYPLKIIFNVPAEAKSGVYKGKMALKVLPDDFRAKAEGVDYLPGAEVSIELKVSKEAFSSFNILRIIVPDSVEDYFLQSFIKVQNKGNSDLTLDKIELDVFSSQVCDFMTVKSDILEKIPPFQTKNVNISFPINLKEGQYSARARIYKEGKAVAEEKIAFSVLSKENGDKGAEKSGGILNLNNKNQIIGQKEGSFLTIILLSLLLISFFVIFYQRFWPSYHNYKKEKNTSDNENEDEKN